MEAFKSHLKSYVSKQISQERLEAELYACLDRNPGNGSLVRKALNNLAQNKILNEDVYTRLVSLIADYEDQLADEDSVEEAFEEGMDAAESGGHDDEVQAEVEDDDDDATRIVQRVVEPAEAANFQDAVKLYVGGEIDPEQLEDSLLSDLEDSPDKSSRYASALDVLEKQGLIEPEVIASLRQQLHAFEAQEHPAAQEETDDEDGDEKTKIFFGRQKPREPSRRNRGDKTSTTGSQTSRTSRTSSTKNTSTASLWNKPFEAEDDVPLTVGSILQGRYKLTEFIGYGGMGDVYKAEDALAVEAGDIQTEIAVKVLNKEFRSHPEALRSMQREARKTQGLAHPHIVNVFSFNRDEAHVFMTMELMRGQDLSDIIKKNPDGMPLDVAKRYVSEMCNALGYAHSQGVIHSDFKPGNIFVHDGGIKILDFGIAREAGSKEEQKDNFDAGDLGALTPSYASLEMIEDDHDPDPRDDIYALGCIAYELITGKHPFRQGKKKLPANKAKEAGIEPARIPTLKSWQWDALKKTLAFDRKDRTGNLDDFIGPFMQESREINQKVIFGGAALAMGLVGLAVYLPTYLTEREVEQFREMVKAGEDHERISTLIEDIQTRDSDERQEFFEQDMRDILLNYLVNRVESQVANDNFEAALPTLERARELYGYHGRFISTEEDFTDQRKEKINELDTQFNDILNSSDFLNRYQELEPLFETFSRVDQNYPQESSSRLAVIEFADASRQLMQEESYNRANQLIEFGLELFKNDQRIAEEYKTIVNLRESLASRLNRQQREQEIAALADTIESVTSASSLQQMLAVVEDAGELYQLEPANATLQNYQQIIKDRLGIEINQDVTTQKWDEAIATVDRFGSALSPADVTELKDSVLTARTTYETRLSDVTRNITRLSRSTNPNDALPFLEQLGQLNVETSVIRDAENQIAQGWLKQARIQSGQRQWETATAYVDRGLSITQDPGLQTELRNEINRIEQLQDQSNEQLVAEEAERMERERLQRIASIESDLDSAVKNNSLQGAEAREIFDLIDQLEIEDSSNPLIESSRTRLAQRYVDESNRLEAAGEFIQALDLVRSGLDLMPSESRLEQQLGNLNQELAQQEAEEKQEQIASLESRLNNLISGFANSRDTDSLLVALQEYEALQGGQNVFSKDIRFQAADVWVTAAEQLNSENRFEDALDAIADAQKIDSSHGRIAGLKQAVQDSRNQFASNQAEIRLQAEIDSLKQSFVAQIQALDISAAKATLQSLRDKNLNQSDPFWRTTVPNEAESAYLSLADRVVMPEGLDEAVDYVEEGLEYKPDSTALQRRLELYQSTELIMTTMQVNVDQARLLLERAKSENPGVAYLSKIKIPTSVASTTPGGTTSSSSSDADDGEAEGRSCSPNMAGLGRRSRATCYDVIGDIKGPRLVVVEGPGGPMAIMRYELRVGDYNNYCNSTGECTPLNKDDNQPATGLSVAQIDDYLAWLSGNTGNEYRIPTYDEWRAAATAGGVSQVDRNCVSFGGSRGQRMEDINAWKTNGMNGWGLAHSIGNAQEIVMDGSSYKAVGGAYPDDNQDCNPSMARGTDGSADDLTGFRFVRKI